jgi:hypothetical protein
VSRDLTRVAPNPLRCQIIFTNWFSCLFSSANFNNQGCTVLCFDLVTMIDCVTISLGDGRVDGGTAYWTDGPHC